MSASPAPRPRATRSAFLAAVRAGIVARYAGPEKVGMAGWANDPEKLDGFMAKLATMLATTENAVGIDSPSIVEAWRAMGMKGKPTYKGLRALPA